MNPAVVTLLLSVAIATAGAAAAPAAADERNPTHLFNPGNYVDESGLVRNRGGQPVGRLEADVEGSHVLRDNAGRHIGNVQRGYAEGELIIRDSDGRRKGTLERR